MEYYYCCEEFMESAHKNINNVDSVLDIGCGIRPFPFITTRTHICCEPYYEYIDVLKEQHKDKILLNMTWDEAVKYIPQKSIDTVLLLDVIEHLEKEEGSKLLLETISLAKKQVVIFTPLGFFEQYHDDGIDAWGYHGGEWQNHKSGWLPDDFPKLPDGEWDFHICSDFHKYTAKGIKLDKPRGAFWAIWNTK